MGRGGECSALQISLLSLRTLGLLRNVLVSVINYLRHTHLVQHREEKKKTSGNFLFCEALNHIHGIALTWG